MHSFLSVDMNHILRLSERVYIGMCIELGSPTQVWIRREVVDVYNVLSIHLWVGGSMDGTLNGSSHEGFRYWPKCYVMVSNHKLMCDYSRLLSIVQNSKLWFWWSGKIFYRNSIKLAHNRSNQIKTKVSFWIIPKTKSKVAIKAIVNNA